jgi:uncharacterized protein YbbC (DUF1343 family)
MIRTQFFMALVLALALGCGHAAPTVGVPAPTSSAPERVPSSPSPDRDAAEGGERSEDAAFGSIEGAVAEAISNRKVPGAVVIVGRHDRVLFRHAYGFRELEPEQAPMTLDTVFDLASLTKPLATATSIAVLVERGLVAFEDPLVKYVPECKRLGGATLRQLLLHVSGLPAGTPVDDYAHGRAEAVRRICGIAPRAAPGVSSTYSDLGFILLEEVVRRVTSQELPAFANAAVFAPLGMLETGFLPADALKRRAAWTEQVDGVWRVGVVHDPRAYRLGGVAGHAGLFSTGDDLAVYARAILGGGQVDGKRILSNASVAALIAPHDLPGTIRALGWSVESSWRGEGLSPRAIGHFGWTGTAIWMDPEKDLFVIVLTNRVHPDGQGDAKPLVAKINTIAARAVGPAVGRVEGCPDAKGGVRVGVDVLRDERFERLRGAHVGLLTNVSGRARDGTSTVDLLRSAPGVSLVALFTPEHGLGGDREGKVANGTDERTGLPVYSLYGDAFAPTAEMLAGIDTMVFDIQDAGTRFFTYASTMRRAMEATRDRGIRFVVLDRPDPIDGVDVAGPVNVPALHSFVNHHSLPVRHGMTMGELAYLLNAEDHLGAALEVVPLRGWWRAAYADETGLPWVNPSPNLRSVAEALLYPAVGLLEATNVSVGRGTDTPFEQLGAPWLDGTALAAALAADALAGVEFAATTFTPQSDVFAGKTCKGVRLTVRDRTHFEPVRTGLAIARELRRLYPQAWQFDKLDRLLVHPDTMRAIDAALPLAEIERSYTGEVATFLAKREKYLLYGPSTCSPAP